MNSKRCFTQVNCELQSKCQFSYMPYQNGYFQPTSVGEHCHHFQPLKTDYDYHEEIMQKMGALA